MSKLVDLTFGIEEGISTCPTPWHPVVEVTKIARHFIEGRETRKVTLGTHTGTHIDAPLHFLADGHSVDQLPLEILIGEALLLDFSGKKNGEEISEGEIGEKLLGIEGIERLVIRTDWSGKWMKRGYFEEYPYLSQGACGFLIQKGVRLLGMDTPSPDNPNDKAGSLQDSPNHKKLLANGIVIVEYLTNLREIEGQRFWLIALPLKLLGCDGAPARVVGKIRK
ncbi:MAG: cyclase family protein [Deltaproteobacteria bacterium]|nr:cyclase family protein [Deltaproteobacteria bacterium]MBW2063928.1 cyclase family protein [Deltaproteobacteria bacterium]